MDWLKSKFSTCNFLLSELTFTIQLELDYNTSAYKEYLSDRRYNLIEQLKKWGFKFPLINSTQEDLLLISNYRKALEGIKTQIGILSNELRDDAKKESQSLNKQLQIATIGLNYPYRLDAKVITVSEWIEICKLLEEKAKNN